MGSYLVSLLDVPELPNSIFWTNQSSWQCDSECYHVRLQVLTAEDMAATMQYRMQVTFKDISVNKQHLL
jgi:hypothetical protein